MIVDSHVHIFPPMGGPAGHRTAGQHLRYVQHMLMNHHQPARRIADNSILETQTLFNGQDYSLDGLTDVNFRGGSYGRLVWTVDGVDYSKQYLPASMKTLDCPPEMMVVQMDYTGVDKAVLHNGHAYGRLNRYIADAVQKYPDRFWGTALVDEWKIDQPDQAQSLDRSINELGLHGLWFQTSYFPIHNRLDTVDDPVFYPFWDHVAEMGIPVFWAVSAVKPGPDSYIAELEAFGRWAKRYPGIPSVFTHGLPLARFIDGDKVTIPDEVWQHLSGPRVLFEILIPIFQGVIWEYPYVEVQPVVREYYERLGPDKLVWGTDMPNVERHCTYKQALDYLRLHCDFIPERDRRKICGDNLARLFARK